MAVALGLSEIDATAMGPLRCDARRIGGAGPGPVDGRRTAADPVGTTAPAPTVEQASGRLKAPATSDVQGFCGLQRCEHSVEKFLGMIHLGCMVLLPRCL